MKQNATTILYVMCWIVLFLKKGLEKKRKTNCSREHIHTHRDRTKECISLSFLNTWAKNKEKCAHIHIKNEHFLVLFLEYTRHTKKKIYICIYYLQTEKETYKPGYKTRER